jgi:hypothetical protein
LWARSERDGGAPGWGSAAFETAAFGGGRGDGGVQGRSGRRRCSAVLRETVAFGGTAATIGGVCSARCLLRSETAK